MNFMVCELHPHGDVVGFLGFLFVFEITYLFIFDVLGLCCAQERAGTTLLQCPGFSLW